MFCLCVAQTLNEHLHSACLGSDGTPVLGAWVNCTNGCTLAAQPGAQRRSPHPGRRAALPEGFAGSVSLYHFSLCLQARLSWNITYFLFPPLFPAVPIHCSFLPRSRIACSCKSLHHPHLPPAQRRRCPAFLLLSQLLACPGAQTAPCLPGARLWPGLTPSGALGEERADTVWGAGAEAGGGPGDLPAEEVPSYATAGGVLEGLMASCLGIRASVCRVPWRGRTELGPPLAKVTPSPLADGKK